MTRLLFLVTLATTAHDVATAESPRPGPPEFTEEDRAAFFDDAFKVLVGPRPDYGAAEAAAENAAPTVPDESGGRWSDIVSADTLETEIKRQARDLADATRSAAAFKAGGFREAGDALTLVALTFAVIAEHDDEPRWRDDARRLRDLFSIEIDAAEGSFRSAKARGADLEDLVRGGRPATPDAAEPHDWGRLVDRGVTMRRMAAAHEERLRSWAADRREFRRNDEGVRHEAEVLALMAEAIARPGAPDADGEDYRGYAAELRRAAAELAAAAEAGDYDAARAALPLVDRSCSDCHADYRG